MDIGSMVWEDAKEYDPLEEMFEDLEAKIAAWLEGIYAILRL